MLDSEAMRASSSWIRCSAIAFTVALARRLFCHNPSNSRIWAIEKPIARARPMKRRV